jgi:hypothetical protein
LHHNSPVLERRFVGECSQADVRVSTVNSPEPYPSWPRITAALLIDVAVPATAGRWPQTPDPPDVAWRVGVGIAVLVAILAVLTYQGIGLSPALAEWVFDWFADSVGKLTAGCTAPIDHQRRFSRDVVSLREYRGRLVSVVALEGPAQVTSGCHHHRGHAGFACGHLRGGHPATCRGVGRT